MSGAAALPCVGDVIAGEYRIEKWLGRGAMGEVMGARHVSLGQRVAIKFFYPSEPDAVHPRARDRFELEARAGSVLHSEHVVRVFDFGAIGGIPYLMMEWLEGKDIARILKETGPLPIDEVVDYVLQAGEGIAEAHEAGIVHRDLKPANLFLACRADGGALVKVLDFGVAKLTKKTGFFLESLTGYGDHLGTVGYMSPEQLENPKSVDLRADIWALGVILYRLLTNQLPFKGGSLGAKLIAILHETPVRVRDLRPEVPAPLDEAIFRCLAKDPEERVQSVAELAEALRPFAPPPSSRPVSRVARSPRDAEWSSLPDAADPSADSAIPEHARISIPTSASCALSALIALSESSPVRPANDGPAHDEPPPIDGFELTHVAVPVLSPVDLSLLPKLEERRAPAEPRRRSERPARASREVRTPVAAGQSGLDRAASWLTLAVWKTARVATRLLGAPLVRVFGGLATECVRVLFVPPGAVPTRQHAGRAWMSRIHGDPDWTRDDAHAGRMPVRALYFLIRPRSGGRTWRRRHDSSRPRSLG